MITDGEVSVRDGDGVPLGPMRRYRGLTWVGWVNRVLQLTPVRLCYRIEEDGSISGWGFVVARPFCNPRRKAHIWPKR